MWRKTTWALGEAVRIAAASLWAHKLRSLLTLLGVVIGVSAVIAVVSLINGANSYVAEKVFNLGTDVFLISRGPSVITDIDAFLETQKRKKLTLEDYEAVRQACTLCRDLGATASALAEVEYGASSVRDSNIRGWTPSMARIYDVELTAGRHLNEADMQRAAPLCVIGWEVAENLFPSTDPLGKEIRVGNHVFEVVGVGKKLGSALGQSRDNWVMIPLRTFQKIYGTEQSLRIWGKAISPAQLAPAQDQARQILRARRHVPYGQPDDFVIETNESFLALWGGISSAFFGVVVVIASISLVVGGIVIMNIMLVSVTERTQEIGLRKSVGARRSDILAQFLVESATVAAIGGLLGVGLGIGWAKLVSLLSPFPSTIELWSVIAGLVVATSVGLFFGIYPASKAARLDPVVAMRSE